MARSPKEDNDVTIVPGDLVRLCVDREVWMALPSWRSSKLRGKDHDALPKLRPDEIATVVGIEPEDEREESYIATLLTSSGQLGCVHAWVLMKTK